MGATRRNVLKGICATSAAAVPLSFTQGAAASPARDRGHVREFKAALRGIVDINRDAPGKAISAIALVRTRSHEVRAGAGFIDWDNERHLNGAVDYQFRAGSVSKTFTATLVMNLVEKGLIKLDDRLRRHLPGIVPHDDKITIRHLLGMSSGIADYVFLLYPGDSMFQHAKWSRIGAAKIAPIDLVRLAASKGPLFEPGTLFDYGTTNYLLLGMLVERVTGRPLARELERVITWPLGLSRTKIASERILPSPALTGYGAFDDHPGRQMDITDTYEHGWAGGALITTREDLARFLRGLLSGRLLHQDVVSEMKVPLTLPGRGGAPANETYGLGLERFALPVAGPEYWGHTGLTHGYRATAWSTGDGACQFISCLSGFPAPPILLAEEMKRLLRSVVTLHKASSQ